MITGSAPTGIEIRRLRAGKRYTYTLWVKYEGANGWIGTALDMLKADGSATGEIRHADLQAQATPGTYTRFSGSLVAPQHTSKGRVWIQSSTGLTVYVDDISVVEEP